MCRRTAGCGLTMMSPCDRSIALCGRRSRDLLTAAGFMMELNTHWNALPFPLIVAKRKLLARIRRHERRETIPGAGGGVFPLPDGHRAHLAAARRPVGVGQLDFGGGPQAGRIWQIRLTGKVRSDFAKASTDKAPGPPLPLPHPVQLAGSASAENIRQWRGLRLATRRLRPPGRLPTVMPSF